MQPRDLSGIQRMQGLIKELSIFLIKKKRRRNFLVCHIEYSPFTGHLICSWDICIGTVRIICSSDESCWSEQKGFSASGSCSIHEKIWKQVSSWVSFTKRHLSLTIGLHYLGNYLKNFNSHVLPFYLSEVLNFMSSVTKS